MNIVLIGGIILTLAAESLALQAVGILIIGLAIFVIDTRCWK